MRSLYLLPVMMGWLWVVDCLNCGRKSFLEANHSAITDCRHVWFKTTKWALEGLVSVDIKKSDKSIPSLAQIFDAHWLCMTLYAVVSLTCS